MPLGQHGRRRRHCGRVCLKDGYGEEERKQRGKPHLQLGSDSSKARMSKLDGWLSSEIEKLGKAETWIRQRENHLPCYLPVEFF